MMQVSEKCRRGVALPLTVNAEEEFRSGDITDNSRFELIELNNDEMYYKLLGLFNEINEECRTLLDDYETELVEVNKLEKVMAVVGKFNGLKQEPDMFEFIEKFKTLLRKAVCIEMPLIFIL